MYFNNLSGLGAETVDRDYFESSVYRNILDMLLSVERVRSELRQDLLSVVGSSGSVKGTAEGFAANELERMGFKKTYFGNYMRLIYGIKNAPWDYVSPSDTDAFRMPPEIHLDLKPDNAAKRLHSASSTLIHRLAEIEWELNRVHLPMVDNLRKVSLLLGDLISAAPNSMPASGAERVASYKAQKLLSEMRTWLASMTEKIQERSEFDAAALERIAAEAAARAKAARQAEADAKAEAERKAAEAAAEAEAERKAAAEAEAERKAAEQEAARQAAEQDEAEVTKDLRDAQEAKQTAAKAAEVEKQIVTSDDVPDKGKGGVLLTLAGGAAAFFFLS